MEILHGCFMVVPEHDEDGTDIEQYPGDVQPGYYSVNEVVEMLRDHKNEPDVIAFIADMMEE